MRAIARPGVDVNDLERDVGARFEREARAVARLRASATITIFDFGIAEGGDMYMIMEYIDGASLREHIEAHGLMAPPRVARVLVQALESLREAHAYGLLHRDIKPENLMIFDDVGAPDRARIVDFGIAKALEDRASDLTAAGIMMGTPRYIPPERVTSDELRPASDLYSLGGVAYYMLTGRELYDDTQDIMKVMRRQARPDSVTLPLDAGVPPALREVVERMLRKSLEERYAAAQQVLDDLEGYVLEDALAARGDSRPSRGAGGEGVDRAAPSPPAPRPESLQPTEVLSRERPAITAAQLQSDAAEPAEPEGRARGWVFPAAAGAAAGSCLTLALIELVGLIWALVRGL